MSAPNEPIVFDQVQIGRGLRPVAQHGFVLVTPQTLTLLGSDEQPIDSAPVGSLTAKPVRFTRGQTVAVTLNETKYTLTPGWGERIGWHLVPGEADTFKTAASYLLHLINNGGRG